MFGLGKSYGTDPRAHRQEVGGAWGGYVKTEDRKSSGIAAGTRIATAMGWRAVEAIAEGDMVLTFDGGMQRVVGVIRGALWDCDTHCPQMAWPLHVPAHALGNAEAMTLLPEQVVMVESDAADRDYGDPFALLKARSLAGYRGIERQCPTNAAQVIQLVFEEDQVVFAASGALMLCPRVNLVSMADIFAGTPGGAGYRALCAEEAALLVGSMQLDDAISRKPYAEVQHAA